MLSKLFYLLVMLSLLSSGMAAEKDQKQAEDELEKALKEHPVDLPKLKALIKEADRIEVTKMKEPVPGTKIEYAVIFTSKNAKDIEAFSAALTVVPQDRFFHCMCLGEPILHLYKGDQELVQISNHHGRSIRCSLWTSDAELMDQEKWLEWFDARKIPGPRKEVEDSNARAKQGEIEYQRWTAAMPVALQPLWEDLAEDPLGADFLSLLPALEKGIPDTRERVLALYHWFGSGAGPWSGFPSYEMAAETLLLKFSTADLVAVAERKNLTSTQLEGAARLFGGWDFSKQREADLKALPASLKKKLLEHSLKSQIEDNKDRAKGAFEG